MEVPFPYGIRKTCETYSVRHAGTPYRVLHNLIVHLQDHRSEDRNRVIVAWGKAIIECQAFPSLSSTPAPGRKRSRRPIFIDDGNQYQRT